MTDNEIISILHDLRSCKHIYAKYSELQYDMAIQYAINKIRSYHDLSRHYATLAKEFSDYKDRKPYEIPCYVPDNY